MKTLGENALRVRRLQLQSWANNATVQWLACPKCLYLNDPAAESVRDDGKRLCAICHELLEDE